MRRSHLIAVLLAALSSAAGAQIVDCVSPNKIYVSHAKGRVFDFNGVPVPDAALTLSAEGRQPAETKTDTAGRFDFRVPAGEYTLSGEVGPLEATEIRLVVGKDLWNTVRPKNLIVIFGIRWMFCSWATTNEQEYRYEINSNRKRIEESAQRNATQK